MKQLFSQRIIVITSLLFVGILLVQVFWVKSVYDYQRKEFDEKIGKVLIYVYQAIDPGDDLYERIKLVAQIDTAKNTSLVDSAYVATTQRLLQEKIAWYFRYLKLDHLSFKAVLYRREINLFLPNKHTVMMLRPANQIKLRRHCYDCNLMLGLYFREANAFYFLRKMTWLLAVTAVLIGLLVFCFAFVVINWRKQIKLADQKNAFINNMTHEFKTPVFTISVAAKVLQQANEVSQDERLLGCVQRIDNASQKLKAHTEQILQTALLNEGNMVLQLKKVVGHAFVAQVVQNYEYTGQTKAKATPTEYTFDWQATQDQVWLDEHHFANLLTNLLDNAHKYARETPLTICLSSYNEDNRWVLSVQDNGLGIAKTDQRQVFDQFYRVNTGNVHNVKGFGLGLHYVKTVVEAHQGEVWVESTVGEGSTFFVALPLA